MESQTATDNPGVRIPGLSFILNAPKELKYGDRTIELRQMTFAQMARYSAFLKDRALSEAERVAATRSPDIAKAAIKAVMDTIACGDYEPGSQQYLASLNNPACAAQALYIVVNDEDDSFTYDDAVKVLESRFQEIVTQYKEELELLKKSFPPASSEVGGRFSRTSKKKVTRSKKSKRSR